MTIKEILAAQPEHVVQGTIVDYLRIVEKCIVLATNQATKKVAADFGVPDLIVTRQTWPNGLWLGLEVKNAKGKPTPEQRQLHELGRIYIVRSIDDAKAALDQFEIDLRRPF